MIKIIFETHGTTLDNEAHLSSGHFDVELSELGKIQAKELGDRYKDDMPDVIFCSDLARAYQTATYGAFGQNTKLIYVDWRLRECDYGDLTRHPSSEVEVVKIDHIEEPFPSGQSYQQCADNMKSFLIDLLRDFDGKTVMIIGHRATQFGLDHWIDGVSLEELVQAKFKWQPGWTYNLEKLG